MPEYTFAADFRIIVISNAIRTYFDWPYVFDLRYPDFVVQRAPTKDCEIEPLSDMNFEESRRIFTTGDARKLARRRLPRLVFDFIDGAAGREVAVVKNASKINAVELQPRVLENVSERHLNASFLGLDYGLPFGIAPMGMCNLIWPGADRMLARAAAVIDPLRIVGRKASNCLRFTAAALLTPGDILFQLFPPPSIHFL